LAARTFAAVFTIRKRSGERPPDAIGLKDIKLHLCTAFEEIIFSHVWATADRNDAAVAPEWIVFKFVLGDAAHDSKKGSPNSRTVGDLMDFPYPPPQ
jgi:hypothetical protein